jgi:hypothetical protein
MNIRETLSNKQTEKITTTVRLNELAWRGIGARLKVASEHNETTMNAFVLERIGDNSLYDGIKSPVVLRLVGDDGAADTVSDYVMYPKEGTLPEAAVYEAPKIISDIGRYLYGEWPIAESFVTASGMPYIQGAMEATLTESGVIEVVSENKIRTFTNLGAISLQAAGTAPIQPMSLTH